MTYTNAIKKYNDIVNFILKGSEIELLEAYSSLPKREWKIRAFLKGALKDKNLNKQEKLL